jgi:hypothetical protein
MHRGQGGLRLEPIGSPMMSYTGGMTKRRHQIF